MGNSLITTTEGCAINPTFAILPELSAGLEAA
jgi:hypothetical protein